MGSSPARLNFFVFFPGHIAQLVERWAFNPMVSGSNPDVLIFFKMLLKETRILISDNSGGVESKCIHVYRNNRNALGTFVKTVLKTFDTKKKLVKKKKYFTLVLSVKRKNIRKDGSAVLFSHTRGLLMADREKFLGSRIYGPMPKELINGVSEQQLKYFKSISSGIV